ncbi:MAG: ABC transporter substrate-binding protein, partial [Gemmatimonadetes bacterium]|nr:ABC transporter substrate-binding protein [Gemmatimonadota bacterium]
MNGTRRGRYTCLYGRIYSAGLAILFLAVSCSGDGQPARPDPEENILRIAVPSDPRSLDPAIAYDVVTWPLVRTLFHGLIDYDDDLNLVPWHARSWTVSEDGRTLTFKLRQDIRFSNGRAITSEDFAYSLERILDPATKSPGQGFYRNIVGARAFQNGSSDRVSGLRTPDSETLEIELAHPDLPFLYCIAMPFAYAVPREEVERHGDNFGRYPVGAGPFTLAHWQRGTGLRLEKNPGYYRADDVRLEAIELMVGGDETLHMMMFERGELDIASVTSTGIPDADFIRVMNDPVLSKRVAHQPLNAIQYLSMNTELPPFDRVNVRRAVNHAIDRERIVRLISDRGILARGVLPPGMPGFDEQLVGYGYDPEKARKLLAEAGYPEGFSTELMITSQSGIDAKIGQAVQQDLAEVGIAVEIRPVTGPTRIEA